MERPRTHAMHGAALGLVAYIVMTMLLKQPAGVAERRSVLLGALSVVYMIFYGHSLPKL